MTKFNNDSKSSLSNSESSTTRAVSNAFSLLSPEIRKNISRKGYEEPTPIQEACLTHMIEGRDLLGTAQTGTGKTAAFSLPLLHRLSMQNKRPNKGRPHALILAPTRELAAQIGECIETYATQLRIRHTVIFGGVSQKRQVDQLNRGVHIVVATPGRLLDLMNQGHIHLNEVNCFILDEVDRMLDMGFIRDIRRISDSLPGKRQTGFFSATMSPPIEKLARTLVKDPIRITISPEQPAVERIDQKVYFLSKNDKNDLLVSLLNEDPSIEKVVVFTRMKHAANRLAKKLDSKRISGTAIHGNKSQNARVRALEGFKNGKFRVLVATDVAARGLDVEGITHVINFDLPTESETYIHRIGRTARAGAEGSAISFCSPDESEEWCAIEKHLGKTVSVETDHPFHAEFVRAKKPAPKNRQPRRRSNRGRGRNRQR